MKIYDIAIIGAGPAGISSAIYAVRAGLDTIIFDPNPIGGLITSTMDLENYPGFPDVLSGMELMEKFSEQLKKLGNEIQNYEVKSITKSNNIFEISYQDTFVKAKSVVIASGSKTKKLNIPREESFIGKGISYCASCDGPLYRNAEVVVVGTGNSGIQEGLFLLKFVKKITFVEFLPYMIAEDILQKRIQEHNNVDIMLSHKIIDFKGDNLLEGIVVQSLEDNSVKEIPCEGVFVFVGYIPNTDFVRGFVELDEKGFIKADDRTLQSSVEGVFVAGDVRNKDFRQVATAVGDGATATFSVQHYLDSLE